MTRHLVRLCAEGSAHGATVTVHGSPGVGRTLPERGRNRADVQQLTGWLEAAARTRGQAGDPARGSRHSEA